MKSHIETIKPLDDEFEFVTEGAMDERKRVFLAKALGEVKARLANLAVTGEALQFRVYVNAAGQILLDPTIAVPARELWLYRNPQALASVRRGVAEAERGELYDLGSFAKYADDRLDD